MGTDNDKLLKLVEAKAFRDLSTEERAFVLEHLSEHEYELQREIMFTSAELVEEESSFLTPDPRIKSNLQQAMRGSAQPVSVWHQLAAYVFRPVPAYQFAIGLALIAALILILNNNQKQAEIVYRDKIVYEEKLDTVYVDRPVVEIQTVERVVKVVEYVVQAPKDVEKLSTPYQSEKDRMAEAAAKNNSFALSDEQLEQHKEKSFGNTSVDSKELARFIVVVD